MKNTNQKHQTFFDYLVANRMSLATAKKYNNQAKAFEKWAEHSFLNTKEINYSDLLDYINFCRHTCKPHTINLKIAILKHYFDFCQTPQNPAREMLLKGVTKLLPKIRFSSEEIDHVYNQLDDYNWIKKRNKIILGLVLYQGVNSKELAQLKVENLDLAEGKIYIPKGHKNNSRTVELKAFQLLPMQNYLLKTRPVLLQKSNKKTDQLLVSTGKGTNLNNVLSRLLKEVKKIEPRVKSFQHLRASVITNWIKEKGLRQAQYLAGHRYVSSTERYEVQTLEDLKNNIDFFHPF